MSDETKDPTNCDRCGAKLEGGWTERWRNDVRLEVICDDCDRSARRQKYANTDVLSTKLMCEGAVYGVRFEGGRCLRDHLLDRVVRETAAVQEAAKVFERDVWFGGLQATVRAASHRGFRAPFVTGGGHLVHHPRLLARGARHVHA